MINRVGFIKFGKQRNNRVRLHKRLLFFCFIFISCFFINGYGQIEIPFCELDIKIDGEVSEWRDHAFNDGEWTIERAQEEHWFSKKRNRLINEVNEPVSDADLIGSYFIAWDENFIYLGAEVQDNVIDVEELEHSDERWYYKDGVAWFFEFPSDTIPERFEKGNFAFCFIADTSKPSYGAWWRHGNDSLSYIENPIPPQKHKYEVQYTKVGYTIEAAISWDLLFDIIAPIEIIPGDLSSMMIVNCDPDGGEYGGHMLIYGKGDNDDTWTKVKFIDPR